MQVGDAFGGTNSTGQATGLSGGGVRSQEEGLQQQQACVSSLTPELVQHPDLDEEHVVQVGCGLAIQRDSVSEASQALQFKGVGGL
jgi:hypothetical protein